MIDSERQDWVERTRSALGGGADVVLDNIGGSLGHEASFALANRGGHFSARGTPSGRFAAIDPAEAGRCGVEVTMCGDFR